MGKSKRLEEIDKRHIWHPFTQMGEWIKEEIVIIEKGEGNYLFDTEGNQYLDGVSSIWCNIHGHKKKEIDKAIKEQLEKIAHSTLLGLSNIPSIKLAERLISISPEGLTRVFYSDNGSTAVEAALKMAFQYWKHMGKEGKNTFIAFSSAYHGDTLGCVSVGGIETFHSIYKPLLFPAYQAYYPYCYRCPVGHTYPSCDISCIERLEEILTIHHEEIAALVIEPILQAASGIIVSPPGFLKRIRELCTKHHVLMIADEVATGFGRTGKLFACEHEGVTPDFLCIAKGLTGGYLPLAATLTKDEVFNAFLGEYRDLKTFFHGHTYTGNPIGCAAAIANIDLFKRERILKKIEEKASFLATTLERFKRHPHIGDVRHIGLVAGIELVSDKDEKEPYPLEEKIGFKVCERVRERGIILRPLGNVIVVMPPLSITEGELKWMLEVIYKSIDEVTSSL